MPINPVIVFNERLEAIEKDFLSSIHPKKILGNYNQCFNIGFLYIILSCDELEIMNKLSIYYNLNSEIRKYSSVAIIKFEINEKVELMEEDFTWLENVQEIKKGKDIYNSTIYKYKNIIFIKSESSHYLKIIASSTEEILNSFSIITKLIEGIVIDQYIGAGYLPVHSSLVKNEKECNLILGHSQTGKTTFAKKFLNRDFSIVTDEITFISNKDIIGFGQYMKEYSSEKNIINIEQYNNVSRKVIKLPTENFALNEINHIFLMDLSKNESFSKSVKDFNEKVKYMIEYLHLFPNEYFIDKDVSYTLLMEVAKRLANIEVTIVNNKYDYALQI